MQSFLTTGLPEADNLDVGINLSGKLQLLDKILAAIKKRSLRVLIIFQVADSDLYKNLAFKASLICVQALIHETCFMMISGGISFIDF